MYEPTGRRVLLLGLASSPAEELTKPDLNSELAKTEGEPHDKATVVKKEASRGVRNSAGFRFVGETDDLESELVTEAVKSSQVPTINAVKS